VDELSSRWGSLRSSRNVAEKRLLAVLDKVDKVDDDPCSG
jgi:hypothetical protein